MELKKQKKKKTQPNKQQQQNAGKHYIQCKIGFRKTRQFFRLLSKLLSGQSAKFL